MVWLPPAASCLFVLLHLHFSYCSYISNITIDFSNDFSGFIVCFIHMLAGIVFFFSSCVKKKRKCILTLILRVQPFQRMWRLPDLKYTLTNFCGRVCFPNANRVIRFIPRSKKALEFCRFPSFNNTGNLCAVWVSFLLDEALCSTDDAEPS